MAIYVVTAKNKSIETDCHIVNWASSKLRLHRHASLKHLTTQFTYHNKEMILSDFSASITWQQEYGIIFGGLCYEGEREWGEKNEIRRKN